MTQFFKNILYITCYLYFDNVKLEIRHASVVDDLRTSTGRRTTTFSCAGQEVSTSILDTFLTSSLHTSHYTKTEILKGFQLIENLVE